jgi:uncharacterized heparinase superfamily protein
MDGRLTRPLGEHPFIVLSRRFIARIKAFYYTSRLHRMRLTGKQPLKLIDSPNYPWDGEAQTGAKILTGVFSYAGHTIKTSKAKPWPDTTNSPEMFYNWLNGFSWLNDLEGMADKRMAQEKAEAVLGHWLEHNKLWSAHAWRPELIGERLISWIFHAPLILSNSDLVYRSKVMNSLLQQSRHLNYVVATAPIGVPRIKASIGLAVSGLLIPDGEERLKRGLKVLEKTLDEFILPDGGVASRTPRDGMLVLKLLIILKIALENQNRERPNWLQFSCDKLVPFLKALSHGDGGFAHFGGAFTNDNHHLKEAIQLSDAKGKASNNFPFSGFQRLKNGQTQVLIDVGTPPEPVLSFASPASALAIEVSDGKDRLIVGLGGTHQGYSASEDSVNSQNWAKKTISHSTVSLNDTNQTAINNNGAMPAKHFETMFERNENQEGIWVDATHDGYKKKLKTRHTRRLYLNENGSDLRGEDIIKREVRGLAKFFTSKEPLQVKVRFHIHPSVSLSPNQVGDAIILRLPHGHGWLFKAKGGHIQIEDVVYSAKPEDDKKSSQIVIESKISANQTLNIKWSLKRLDQRE